MTRNLAPKRRRGMGMRAVSATVMMMLLTKAAAFPLISTSSTTRTMTTTNNTHLRVRSCKHNHNHNKQQRERSMFGIQRQSQSRPTTRGSRSRLLLQLQLSSSHNNEHGSGNENDKAPFFFKPSVTPEDLLGGYGGTGEQGKRKLLDKMAALYSDEQMARLLDVHAEVESEILEVEQVEPESDPSSSIFTSLHDLITHNIEQGELETKGIVPELLAKSSNIQAIASDVDGTLISTNLQIMHPRTLSAVRRAIQHASIDFFPATGKSRRGALNSLGPEIEMLMRDNKTAGVFLGGLYCVDGLGKVLFERKLPKEAIHQVEVLVADVNASGAADDGVSVVGYDGDNLYSTKMTDIVVHLSEHYGEPMPQLLLSNNEEKKNLALADHEPGMHKLLIMSDDTSNLSEVVRPQLDQLALKYGGTVTQALPTMLELIPQGCSKAVGIQAVCDALGITDPASQLLALGDAENDVAVLELAAIGVAVGNASPPAQDAADHVMDLACDQGGAGCAMELFAFQQR